MAKRRRVVALLSGALSTTLLLGGCLGNPPSRTGNGTRSPAATPVAANADVEVRTISLGFVPILEAAPLVIGAEKGFFAKHGLDVKLSKQSSWSAARDNVVLGAAGSKPGQQRRRHEVAEGVVLVADDVFAGNGHFDASLAGGHLVDDDVEPKRLRSLGFGRSDGGGFTRHGQFQRLLKGQDDMTRTMPDDLPRRDEVAERGLGSRHRRAGAQTPLVGHGPQDHHRFGHR